MIDIDELIREKLGNAAFFDYNGILRLVEAVYAVLDLKPPTEEETAYPEGYALLTDGWRTCAWSVRMTIAEALGVEFDE